MNQLFFGALTMGCLVAALLFLRFWKLARDRLLLFFAFAFGSFALNWIALALVSPTLGSRHYVYLLRLLGFAFIIVGIVDKNRRSGR